uniref:Reverse transcriptase domain-containing protein n=1 Tax=Tanacetum cinerariifolium TaxID=118510 RepID=A0A699UAB1_TANCI|nr:hypothetical protein [Tanacetum cinerariifolium]
MPPTNNESTKDVQPQVVQIETLIPNFKLVVGPVVKPVEATVIEESGLAEPELGNPGLDKSMLDKLKAGFDHD